MSLDRQLFILTLIMFDPNMAYNGVELKCEREYVVVVAAVTHDERPVRLVLQHPLRHLS